MLIYDICDTDRRYMKIYLKHFLILLNISDFCSIMKLFAAHKDDRRRVEKALEVSGLPIGKADAIPLQKLHFEDFFNLYKNLTVRPEVEKLFDEM